MDRRTPGSAGDTLRLDRGVIGRPDLRFPGLERHPMRAGRLAAGTGSLRGGPGRGRAGAGAVAILRGRRLLPLGRTLTARSTDRACRSPGTSGSSSRAPSGSPPASAGCPTRVSRSPWTGARRRTRWNSGGRPSPSLFSIRSTPDPSRSASGRGRASTATGRPGRRSTSISEGTRRRRGSFSPSPRPFSSGSHCSVSGSFESIRTGESSLPDASINLGGFQVLGGLEFRVF